MSRRTRTVLCLCVCLCVCLLWPWVCLSLPLHLGLCHGLCLPTCVSWSLHTCVSSGKLGPLDDLVVGLLAGIPSSLITCPLDVIKTRIQSYGSRPFSPFSRFPLPSSHALHPACDCMLNLVSTWYQLGINLGQRAVVTRYPSGKVLVSLYPLHVTVPP